MNRSPMFTRAGLRARRYSAEERAAIARRAFWQDADPLSDYIRWVNGYQMDGQRWPANGLTLAAYIATVRELPDDQIARFTSGPLVPLPGDAVQLHAVWWGAAPGSIAVIDGHLFQPETGAALLVFRSHTFRGAPTNLPEAEQADYYVSCSGGPCPPVALAALRYSGRSYPLPCWRWQDIPRAGGGVEYTIHVPLWDLATAPD